MLAEKHYRYQFVFAEDAGHVDRAVRLETLPEALGYVWQGCRETAADRNIPVGEREGPVDVPPVVEGRAAV